MFTERVRMVADQNILRNGKKEDCHTLFPQLFKQPITILEYMNTCLFIFWKELAHT